jgi:hypothetical protein
MKADATFAEILNSLTQSHTMLSENAAKKTQDKPLSLHDPLHYFLKLNSKSMGGKSQIPQGALRKYYKNQSPEVTNTNEHVTTPPPAPFKSEEKTILTSAMSKEAQAALLVLGIDKIDIKETHVKAQFRKLAKLHHPDGAKSQTPMDSTKAWMLIANAYEVLRLELSRLKKS